MNRDSVTLRENPCSSKNIRNIRDIRTEQKPLNFQHNEEVHQTNPADSVDRPGDWSLGAPDSLQRHPSLVALLLLLSSYNSINFATNICFSAFFLLSLHRFCSDAFLVYATPAIHLAPVCLHAHGVPACS